jgi:hypothetical protein
VKEKEKKNQMARGCDEWVKKKKCNVGYELQQMQKLNNKTNTNLSEQSISGHNKRSYSKNIQQ